MLKNREQNKVSNAKANTKKHDPSYKHDKRVVDRIKVNKAQYLPQKYIEPEGEIKDEPFNDEINNMITYETEQVLRNKIQNNMTK